MASDSNRCHIALFMQSFSGGGAERVMVSTANLLAARGAEVDLIVVSSAGPLLSEVSKHINIVDLRQKSAIRAIPKLAKYLKKNGPAVIMSTVDNANLAMLLTVSLFRIQVRTVVRLANAPSFVGKGGKGLKSLLFRVLAKPILNFNKRADLIVAVSQGVADDFAKRSNTEKQKIKVIYNPVLALPLAQLAKEDVPVEGLFGDDPVIVAVGRLAPQKDYQTLIHAFADLTSRRKVKLCIVGEGDERDVLTQLAKDLGVDQDVVLVGFDRNPFKYMSRASVFVLSSRHEGLPNVLIQAMALKVPVVATDCPHGPREILENGRWGLLVRPGVSEELAAAIEQQLDCPMPPVPYQALNQYLPDRVTAEYWQALCPEKCV